MNNRNTIQDELNELNSGLNSNSNGTPYSVPEGYFEGLAASVMAKIKGEDIVSASEEIRQLSPVLAGISRSMPHSVPDDYFQLNMEGLKAFTSEEEESVVLSFIDKEMPYEVPAGYFANVPEQVLEKVSKPAKVVPLMQRKWMRLAVAAVITGFIAVSGIVYFNNRSGNTTGNGSNAVPVAVELKKASTEELKQFINNNAVVMPDDNTATTASKTSVKTERKNLFNDVSDKELEAFLKQVPTEDEEIDLN
jgi:hypothetical protein